MRGLVALSLILTLASLSGCVSLVEDGSNPDVEEAAAEADRALDEYQAKAGHIAGLVSDADGQPLAGALVDLVGIQTDLSTDETGHFAFLDLKPGVYTLIVDGTGYEAQQATVDVTAGQFSRPAISLQAVKPAAYSTVFHFEGYQDFNTFGLGFSCWCDFSDALDPTGLTQAVLEARLGGSAMPMPFEAYGFDWFFESWDDDGNTTYAEDGYYNFGPSPLYAVLNETDFQTGATQFGLHIEPSSGLQTSVGQEFEGFLTFFYNGPAPEGYTAYVEE